MMKLVQIMVFLAVWFSNIHFGWGSEVSGLAVSVVATGAAFAVTLAIVGLQDLFRRFQLRKLARSQQSINDSRLPRRHPIQHVGRNLIAKVGPTRG